MSGYHFDVAPLPGYHDPYGILLAAMQDGTREWRGEMGDLDPKLIVWQPVPKGHSIGGVLLHIAECEAWWVEEVCLGRAIDPEEAKLHMTEEIDQYNGSWPTPPEEPMSYYYDILDRVRARTLESVKSFPAEGTVQAHGDTYTPAWVLSHVLQHESYHGGQAVLLQELGLRLRGN